MSEARQDLGMAQVFKAEALGTPGKRTFRFVVEAERGSAAIWVEKEHVSALALGIQKVLEQLPDDPAAVAPMAPAATAREPLLDFKAVALGLAYDEGDGTFSVLAYDSEDADKDTPTVACSFSRDQARRLVEEALELVAAGRPICPLCRQPIDPEGHVCPHSNGHKSVLDEL